jgi:hypothetical protein
VTCLSLFISRVPTSFACFPLNPAFSRRLVPPRFNRTIPGISPEGLRRSVRRTYDLTTFMCRMSRNSASLNLVKLKGLSGPVMGNLYLYHLKDRVCDYQNNISSHLVTVWQGSKVSKAIRRKYKLSEPTDNFNVYACNTFMLIGPKGIKFKPIASQICHW